MAITKNWVRPSVEKLDIKEAQGGSGPTKDLHATHTS